MTEPRPDLRRRTVSAALGALATVLLSRSVEAQFLPQTVRLQPGWNSIHLEVEPAQTSCAALVEKFPDIESVWSYDNCEAGEAAFAPEDFEDPTPPVPVKRRWRVFHPDHPAANDLHHLRGGRAYLIRVRDGAPEVIWELLGTPTSTRACWVTDDYTLVGFPLDPELSPDERPTFAEYLAGSEVHLAAGSGIYRLDGPGNLLELDRDADRIEPGHAYFVYTAGASDYRGPVEVGTRVLERLDFGRELVQTELAVRNALSEAQTLSVRLRPGQSDVPPGATANAGPVALQLFNGETQSWVDLDGLGVEITIPARTTRRLRLQARRQGLSIAVRDRRAIRADGGGGGVPAPSACYQGVVEIGSPSGSIGRVPVCVEVPDRRGLWVGTARLEFVRKLRRGPPPVDPETGAPIVDPETGESLQGDFSMPPDFPDPVADRAPELDFPLLVHVAAGGELTLLDRIGLYWKDGREDDPFTAADESEPGRYVLLSAEGIRARLAERLGLVGGETRDGRDFVLRRSAPTFPRALPLRRQGAGTGEFDGSGSFAGRLDLSPLHPRNPFLHRYHPDHGHPKIATYTENLPARGGARIVRSITLRFDAENDPRASETVSETAQPGYGDRILGGTYREVIERLTYHPVVVEGTFRLYKAIDTPVLDDGQEL